MEFMVSKCLLIFLLISSFYTVLASNRSSPSPSKPILCHDHEKQALLSFKQSFHIDCDTSIYPYPRMDLWGDGNGNHIANTSNDCCNWGGIECDKKMGYVVSLNLSGSCLYGSFPSTSTVFDLQHLQHLSLADNNFNLSQIPAAIGRLYRLTTLDLSNSVFSGEIPLELCYLSRLTYLDLSLNADSSGRTKNIDLKLHKLGLEKLVRNLTRLSTLILDTVDISSAVPSTLSNLTSLKVLRLRICNLFGEFPAGVFTLPNLEVIQLGYNQKLGGSLPEFLPGSHLSVIDLHLTAFTGEISASIGKLSFLTMLELSKSGFSGRIPSSLGNLTKLTYIALGGPGIRGDIPSSLTNITTLETLSMSYLNISPSDLNSWLLKLNILSQLALYNMDIGGQIPPALANITERLNFLDLSNCGISGPVPPWLVELTRLTDLNLAGNPMVGVVPQWLPQLSELKFLGLSFEATTANFSLFLEVPNLQGLVLSGVNLTFPLDTSSKPSPLKFGLLELENCNLIEFPQFLRNQDQLQELRLGGNKIVGVLPKWFLNVTRESLVSLNLSNNMLTGFELGSDFYKWKNLEVFDFSGNRIEGPLPTASNSLQIYQVSSNQFSGVIPKQVCEADSLIYLDLSNNSLNGRIPSCVTRLLSSSLEVLNLRGNNFIGTIPENFTSICSLKMIDFSQNHLTGKLPRSLINCTMLEFLNFGKNRIRDTFPSWLGSLPMLQALVLSHNNFHGRIIAPESSDNFQSLRIIDLSFNRHKGNLPYKYLQN